MWCTCDAHIRTTHTTTYNTEAALSAHPCSRDRVRPAVRPERRTDELRHGFVGHPDAGRPRRAARRGWSRGQTLAAVGVAAVIAAFGGAAIYAATGLGHGRIAEPPAGRWGGPRSTEDPGRGPDGWRGPAAP